MTQDPRETFSQLFGVQRWQQLQAHFCQVLGLTLRTLSPDRKLIGEPNWPAGLDPQEVTERFGLGEELEELLPTDTLLKQTAVISRPLGVSFAAIPLRSAADRILAYLIVGPVVLGTRERIETFQARIEAIGLDPEPIYAILLAVKLYSYSSFKSVLSFLEETGNTLLELALQSKEIKATLPEAAKVDHWVQRHYSQRLCHSLLEVAATATKAEGGSVMLFDAASRSYRIAAAQGLNDEIARNTRVLQGEGIAGLAAQRGQMLLVDEGTNDPELKARMRRPSLTSSLVAPLTLSLSEEPALGILNLRTTRTDACFTQEDANFVAKLMELAQSAFLNIPPGKQ